MDGGTVRVGITVGPSGHGGIATYSREIVAALSRRTDVELVLIGDPDEIATVRGDIGAVPTGDVPPRDVAVTGPRAIAQLRIALLGRSLRRRRLDVVHVTRLVAPLRWAGPIVMTFHDDYPITRRDDYDAVKKWLLPSMFRRSLQRATAIVTLNAEMREQARTLGDAEAPIIDAGAAVPTRLAVAVERVPGIGRPHGPFAIVIGDAGPRKDVDRVVERWAEVAQQRELELVLLGARAASGELLDSVDRTAGVAIVSTVSDAELVWWYRNAELVIDPSAEEGFGFPRVEAARFGTRFVALRALAAVDDWVDAVVGQPADAVECDLVENMVEASASWDDVADATVMAYRMAMTRERERE